MPMSAGRAVPDHGKVIAATLPRQSGATPVPVFVLASDSLTREGTVAYLRSCPQITPVTEGRPDGAGLVLVMAGVVTEQTLSQMERVAAQEGAGAVRFVLVCEQIREPQLFRAVACGLVSVVPRQDADHSRIVRAVVNASEGRGEMPGYAVGWLTGRIRSVQDQVLEPHGLTPAGFRAREIDVLRLLADGLETTEIAAELNYSERTVKNIIHGMLSRMRLRNRPHAVAHALRSGVL
jgi:DNA-binding NarL/FixJ family response regulator